MSTAVTLRNVVGKAVDVFLEAIVPLQRHFDANTVFFGGEVEDIRVDRRFVLVQIFNERLDAAFIVEVVFFAIALVAQTNGNAGVEERQLTQTFRQNFIFELGHIGEGFKLGQKRTMVPVFSVSPVTASGACGTPCS